MSLAEEMVYQTINHFAYALALGILAAQVAKCGDKMRCPFDFRRVEKDNFFLGEMGSQILRGQ